MKVYRVEMEYTALKIVEVEARSEEHALDQAFGELIENIENVELGDYTITLADSQYTDSQELQDRERSI